MQQVTFRQIWDVATRQELLAIDLLEGKVDDALIARLDASTADMAAFGMSVTAWSPNLTTARAAEHGVTYAQKTTLFAESDVISLHLPLSQSTANIVGARELDMLMSAFGSVDQVAE